MGCVAPTWSRPKPAGDWRAPLKTEISGSPGAISQTAPAGAVDASVTREALKMPTAPSGGGMETCLEHCGAACAASFPGAGNAALVGLQTTLRLLARRRTALNERVAFPQPQPQPQPPPTALDAGICQFDAVQEKQVGGAAIEGGLVKWQSDTSNWIGSACQLPDGRSVLLALIGTQLKALSQMG